jgi:hypothetical protein
LREKFQNQREDRYAAAAFSTSRRVQPLSTTPDLSLRPPDEFGK